MNHSKKFKTDNVKYLMSKNAPNYISIRYYEYQYVCEAHGKSENHLSINYLTKYTCAML